MPAIAAARGAGIVPTFYAKDRVVPSVAASDNGRVAATALGKTLVVREIPESVAAETLTGEGFLPDVAEQYRVMVHAVNDGTLRVEGGNVRQVQGTVTSEDWFLAAVAG